MAKGPLHATALLKAAPHRPADIADGMGLALVLRFVFGAVAKPTPESCTAVDDPATPSAARASEPVPDAAEMHRRRHDGDPLIDDHWLRAASGRALEPELVAVIEQDIAIGKCLHPGETGTFDCPAEPIKIDLALR